MCAEFVLVGLFTIGLRQASEARDTDVVLANPG